MIDGNPADPGWNGRFAQSLPDEGQPPTERSQVHVGDVDAPYVAVRLFDSAPSEIADSLSQRDCIGVTRQ